MCCCASTSPAARDRHGQHRQHVSGSSSSAESPSRSRCLRVVVSDKECCSPAGHCLRAGRSATDTAPLPATSPFALTSRFGSNTVVRAAAFACSASRIRIRYKAPPASPEQPADRQESSGQAALPPTSFTAGSAPRIARTANRPSTELPSGNSSRFRNGVCAASFAAGSA